MNDLGTMVVHAASSLSVVLWTLLWAISGLVGTLYAGQTLMKMHRASVHPGHHQSVGIGQVAILLIVAAILLNLSKFINLAWKSVGSGDVAYGPISYAPAASFGQLGPVINACLTLGSVAGGFYAFKGVLLLKKAAIDGNTAHGSDDNVWRGLTHILAGAVLVQIPQFIDAARQTLGLMG
jgi:hypothetical protein